MKKIDDMKQLIALIQNLLAGTGKIWDDRIVSVAPSNKSPDIKTGKAIIGHDEVSPFVEKLINEGTPFVLSTGTQDKACTVEWTIA